jgi:hypothetical protein
MSHEHAAIVTQERAGRRTKAASFIRHLPKTACGLVLLVMCAGIARGTTVRAVGFDELCRAAAVIMRGRVVGAIAAESMAADGSRIIETRVTFEVERVLKGSAAARTTIVVPGGRVGDREMVVSGVPSLAIGDRVLVFVGPEGSSFVPFVGVDQGVFRIDHDGSTGVDVIAPRDAARLRRVEALRARQGHAAVALPMSSDNIRLEVFEDRIHALME